MRLGNDLPSRLARLCFCLLLVVAWSASPATFADPAAAANEQEDLHRAADGLEKAIGVLEAADREVPRDTFDVTAIVTRIGRDPAALLAWVRDQTRWVPYRGALRGATGVLMDRHGNSLDRSLLLVALVQAAGGQARLAHAALSEDQGKQVLSQMRAAAPTLTTAPADAASDQELEKYAADHQIDAQTLRREMAKQASEYKRMAEDVAQRVTEQTPVIAGALGKPAAAPADDARELEAVRDHWWSQVQDGDKWVDLDPQAGDGKPGAALAAAQETIPVGANDGKLPLDAALCHEVQLRVVIERWIGASREEAMVLEQTLRPAELAGRHVGITFYPTAWPDDLDLLKEASPAPRIKTAVLAQHEWIPMLSLGAGKMIVQGSFSDSGQVNPKPQVSGFAKIGGGVRGGVEGAAGMFGVDEPKPPPDVKPQAQGVLTAAWIECEIRSPGQAPRKVRRDVFDLLGPARRAAGAAPAAPDDAQRLRRGLAMVGQSDILVLGCQLSPEFVEHLALRSLLDNRESLTGVLRNAASQDAKKTADQIGRLAPLPASLYTWALGRSAFSRHRQQVYLDRPNVVSLHRRLGLKGQDQLTQQMILDIVANEVGVHSPLADRFAVRVEQGIVDTNVESFMLPGYPTMENAAEVFAHAKAAGIGWTLLRSAKDPAWQTMQLPEGTRARIEQDLSAGYAVLAPAKPVALNGADAAGWWRVDPTTGDLLGMGEHGGVVFSENAMEYIIWFAWVFTTNMVGCTAAAKDTSGLKGLGCAVCSAVAATLFTLAFAASVGAAAGAARAAASANGARAGAITGGACAIYGAAAN